ncbi:MAG: sulfite exporter TauE/SafE family protein [Pseudohongiellaceae bacterium]
MDIASYASGSNTLLESIVGAAMTIDASIALPHVAAGGLVGFAIGATGVGGGSLMTPILLLFGYSPAVAIGTDLLYAAITKTGGVISHHNQHSIDWLIVWTLAAGSLPAASATHLALSGGHLASIQQSDVLLTSSLGIMLILTAVMLSVRNKLRANAALSKPSFIMGVIHKNRTKTTFLLGIILGVSVTLSSVGAGAFAAAILMTLYANTKSVRIVGTDIAHAVPLTLVAGLGYLFAGKVDLALLTGLLIGSLPAIQLGAKIAHKMPERFLRGVLIVLLGGLGAGYLISGASK